MRSIKLLVAMAAVAALVAGPVLAQEMTAPATDTTAPAAGKSTAKKHSGKKHTGKKHKKASTSAPATTPAQ